MTTKFCVSLLTVTALVLVLMCGGCSQQESPAIGPASPQLKVFSILPASMESDKNPATEAKVNLGRMLYYEKRVSKGQDISCNDCHNLQTFGVDNEPTSDGHKGQRGDRNSPTVYNAAGHFVQFWDGRAADVEEQAKGPVLNPVEMAMPTEKHVLAVLNSIPQYVEAFKAAFPDEKNPVTYDNFGNAVGAFERGLVTPGRWDKFLAGDATALTEAEKAGLSEFLNAGCQTCHLGAYLGGSMFQKLGLAKPYPDMSDPGREKVTKSESDRMMFKVPGLRNIAKTAPYYHTGKVGTLNEAVSLMAEHQTGKTLTPPQVDSIIAFLNALTGDPPAPYIAEPQLPPGTAKTPKADLSD